jgi:hypothetical protein
MSAREKIPENKRLLDLLKNLEKINNMIKKEEYLHLNPILLERTLNNYYAVRENNNELYIDEETLHQIKGILYVRNEREKYNFLLERIRDFKIFVQENKLLFNELEIEEYYERLIDIINHLEKEKNNLYEKEKVYELSLKNTYDDL